MKARAPSANPSVRISRPQTAGSKKREFKAYEAQEAVVKKERVGSSRPGIHNGKSASGPSLLVKRKVQAKVEWIEDVKVMLKNGQRNRLAVG